MSTSMLWSLAGKRLPATVRGRHDVDTIQILVWAGHVEADFAPAVPTPSGWLHPSAEVRRITRLGRRMLRHFPPYSLNRSRKLSSWINVFIGWLQDK